MDKPERRFHELVAEKLIEQLQAGTAPWQKPWNAGEPGEFLPMNPVTGKRYRGINAIHLMSQGFDDVRWLTYRQAVSADAQVRKGEKGTMIQYWKFSEEQNTHGAGGGSAHEGKGESVKQPVQMERPRVFLATVFNAHQIDGLAEKAPRVNNVWDAIDLAERIIRLSGASIRHGETDRAFYRAATDSIHLPDKSQFPSADAYYATALHELGHWTGHGTRLGRDLAHPFGSEGYAKEELRAEIASMIIGDELGIGHDPGQHVAYVGSWIKALREDPLEIFRAAADAEKIRGYVLGQALEREATLTSNQEARVSFQNGSNVAAELTRSSSQIDAHSLETEYERAASMALLNEERVSADPSSSDEDLAAAKQARKDAEFAATYHDADLQRRIALERDRLAAATVPTGTPDGVSIRDDVMVLLSVPFKEKDAAKALGAKWDRVAQSWFVPAGVDCAPLAKWAGLVPSENTSTGLKAEVQQGQAPAEKGDQRVYLAMPYGERARARAAGAEWDNRAKSWYAGPAADLVTLERCRLTNALAQQAPAMTPNEEFAEVLRSLGCVVSGPHPMMDGATHRITVQGERHSEKAGSGFYVGYLDGHPAGYIKNNKTGIEIRWKAKGYSLGPDEKARLMADAATKLQAREAEQRRLQERTAERLRRELGQLENVAVPTPYMVAKGISVHSGAMTDREGLKTYIPATDVDGKLWSFQYILEDGTKRFAKHSRVKGCFHAVGGVDKLSEAPALVIAEGYATAASLAQTLGFVTVAAFNSGNLAHVAKKLHEKYPDKAVIIAGDDDRHLEASQSVNPGREKARDAAAAVGGTILLPIFAPGEMAARPKEFTDFNDLANKSVLGAEGLDRQVRPIVNAAIDRTRMQIGQVREQEELMHDWRRKTTKIT